MSLGNLSILLTRHGAFYRHLYRGHGAGTKSQLTQTIKHSSGNTSKGLAAAVNSGGRGELRPGYQCANKNRSVPMWQAIVTSL